MMKNRNCMSEMEGPYRRGKSFERWKRFGQRGTYVKKVLVEVGEHEQEKREC